MLFKTEIEKGAEFSECGRHRYALWRTWGDGQKVLFCGLNPSIADANKDDPTMARCISFAKSWGYDGLIMVNAFSIVETNRHKAMAAADRNGPLANAKILEWRDRAAIVVAAWGATCPLCRETELLNLFNCQVYCIRKTKHGRPEHPLYLPGNLKPVRFAIKGL